MAAVPVEDTFLFSSAILLDLGDGIKFDTEAVDTEVAGDLDSERGTSSGVGNAFPAFKFGAHGETGVSVGAVCRS